MQDARALQSETNRPKALTHMAALLSGTNTASDAQFAAAAEDLRAFLEMHPADLKAIRLSIQVQSRLGRFDDAADICARAVALAPERTDIREEYVQLLHRASRAEEANEQLDVLLKSDPENTGYLTSKACMLALLGCPQEALEYHERILAKCPGDANTWVLCGHALRAARRQQDSITAYRKAIALQPELGVAWWCLADFKTFRFEPAEIETMKGLVEGRDLPEDHRYHLHFTLGKALEDQGAYADSFQHYRKGNTIRRAGLYHSPDAFSDFVRRHKALFTGEFFAARESLGCPSPDPVFVVSLPRAGSTLVEQILASHSMIEGTSELPHLASMLQRLVSAHAADETTAYIESLQSLDGAALRALGEEYLDRTRVHRRSAQPFFVDKMPSNFRHIGFMHLILPKAKIIDVRRHPLACGFSNFKQLFDNADGIGGPSYDLSELGRYYRDYVELMAHFDAVLPGRVHRVFYENLVRDPETEIRRLLDYCGVPFEESCLRFHETKRSVFTVSSEQVRRPLYTDALEHWRHYEPWLGPLKKALGPVLTAYPDVPEFA